MRYLQNGKVELLSLKLTSDISDINPKGCTKKVASVYSAPSTNLKEKI